MKTMDLGRLGTSGVTGIGLLLFCASFYMGSVAPAQEQLASLKNEEMQLLQSANVRNDIGHTEHAAPPAPLPPFAEVPDLLKKISTIAEQYGISIDHVSYQQTYLEQQQCIEMSLPLKTGYPALRKYLHDVLALSPGASLEELSLQRAQAGDVQLDANVKLSFVFAGSAS